jgi:sarcosine oxidase subunit gamma
MAERRSALAAALARGGRDGADGARRLRLGEIRGWSLVQVAAFPARRAEVERALLPLVGGRLPQRVDEVIDAAGLRLMRIGPEQIWIIGHDGSGLERQLHQAVAAGAGAVTPLSHSRTRISIEGDAAGAVLMKGVPLDFHPDAFRVDQAALTGLHHTPVLIHRAGTGRFEIYAMRSFAESVWAWLADAALEFGYEVVPGDAS